MPKKKILDDPFYNITLPIKINKEQKKIIKGIPDKLEGDKPEEIAKSQGDFGRITNPTKSLCDFEIFVPVQCGYDNYYVSNQGRIWNNKTKKFIRGTKEDEGYRIELTKDKKVKSIFLHRLVAHHFIPIPQNSSHKVIQLGKIDDSRVIMLQWAIKKKKKTYKKQVVPPEQIDHEIVINKIPKKDDTEIYVRMIKKDGSNYDYYYISNKGNIWYSKMNRYVLGTVNRAGYVKIHIDDDHYYLHKAVLQHFSKNPENKKEGNHIGNKQENSINKLEYTTHKENMIHAAKHIIKYKTKGVNKINKQTLKIEETFPSLKLAKIKGYYGYGINNAIKNKTEYKGYLWNEVNKKEPEIIIEGEKWVYLKDSIYKEVNKYTNYQVSDYGRVRGMNNEIIKNSKNTGVDTVKLCKNSKSKSFLVHRLVIMAFNKKNPKNKPEVDHIDSNPYNNKLENLRWADKIDQNNNEETRKKRLKQCLKKFIKIEVIYPNKNITIYTGIRKLCSELKMSQTTIHKYSDSGEKYKGYKFKILGRRNN